MGHCRGSTAFDTLRPRACQGELAEVRQQSQSPASECPSRTPSLTLPHKMGEGWVGGTTNLHESCGLVISLI